jgi:hypothetical protein
MTLTLLLPDAIPYGELFLAGALPRLPALELLLARGARLRKPGLALEEWLLDTWNVHDCAVAPLTLLADGGEPAASTWLRADPVLLRFEGKHIRLLDHHHFDLETAEADSLIESLNRHFAQDGIAFMSPQPKRWYARIPSDDLPLATPLWKVAGKSILEHLPQSQGRRDWKALANEIQMLLFDHPVNAARESRGAPAVNAVWLWGAGGLPAATVKPFNLILSDLPLARGLAMNSRAVIRPLAPAFAAFSSTEDSVLIVLHQLTKILRTGDADSLSPALTRIEEDWIVPALAALRNGQIDTLRLCLPSQTVTLDCRIRRSDLLKFWRRPRALAAYA